MARLSAGNGGAGQRLAPGWLAASASAMTAFAVSRTSAARKRRPGFGARQNPEPGQVQLAAPLVTACLLVKRRGHRGFLARCDPHFTRPVCRGAGPKVPSPGTR
jgi:hypothetical protein